MDHQIGEYIVWGILLAIAVVGYVSSSSSANKLDSASRPALRAKEYSPSMSNSNVS